jgi:hypothetical protein
MDLGLSEECDGGRDCSDDSLNTLDNNQSNFDQQEEYQSDD